MWGTLAVSRGRGETGDRSRVSASGRRMSGKEGKGVRNPGSEPTLGCVGPGSLRSETWGHKARDRGRELALLREVGTVLLWLCLDFRFLGFSALRGALPLGLVGVGGSGQIPSSSTSS